eukprot:jgi/Psemu1/19038/gm1.19038_g
MPSPPALSFSPALTFPRKDIGSSGPPGGGGILTRLKDPAGDKALSPAAKLDLIKTQALEAMNPTKLKAAFAALAGLLKEFQTHLIQSEMKVEELDLSSVDLQLAAIKLIIGQQNGGHTDTLVEANAKFTDNFGKLKAQPPALAKNKQDKVMQLFNYFSPDLSELSLRIYLAIMNSLGGILEFFKACSTQTTGDILLDRISRLEQATTKPFLHAQFTSFREESKTTKVCLVNTYFTSQTDMGAWCTLHANNSASYLHVVEPHSLLAIAFNSKGGTGSDNSFESFTTRKSGYSSPKVALVMKSFQYAVPEMCQTYQDLKKPNPSSSKENWRYVSHCVQAIFEHLHKARKVGAKLGVNKPRWSSHKTRGCLQGRQAVLEFTQDGFSNHRVVQPVFNEHMRHRAIMRDEMNTHLAALKKEQEEGSKESICMGLGASESSGDGILWSYRTMGLQLHTAEITQCKYSSKMTKGICWLGLQDTAHKQTSPSQELGAWAGATVSTNNGQACKGINVHDKHTKAGYPYYVEAKLENDGCRPLGKMHHKMLEFCVGFQVYAAMWYTSMVPYLKGLYLTLNSWKLHQEVKGWAIPLTQQNKIILPKGDPPTWVSTVSQFEASVNPLIELSYANDPPRIPAGACNKELSKEKKIHAKFGAWSEKVSNGSLSNFREAVSLVESLKCNVASGVILRGAEVFMFMDNFVEESTMYKGFSSSKLLHNMLYEFICHATLGAFWSGERSTVAGNWREVICYFDYQAQVGSEVSFLPPWGPMPQEDSWGMKVPGTCRNAQCVQFETMRKRHPGFTNFVHTCPDGVTAHLHLQGRGSDFVSTSVTFSLWFKRFTAGCHRQMGNVWLPDALEKWQSMTTWAEQEKFDFTSCTVMSLSGFYGGLCGEDIFRISLLGINHYWAQSTNEGNGNTCIVPLILAAGADADITTRPLFMSEDQDLRATIVNLDRPFHDMMRENKRRYICHPERKGGRQYYQRKPLETLGGWWITSSSTRHRERPLKILMTACVGRMVGGANRQLVFLSVWIQKHICSVKPQGFSTGDGLLGYVPTGDARGGQESLHALGHQLQQPKNERHKPDAVNVAMLPMRNQSYPRSGFQQYLYSSNQQRVPCIPT